MTGRLFLRIEEVNAMKLKEIDMKELLKGSKSCKCGREHKVDLKSVVVKENAIDELPKIMEKSNYKKAFLVADKNTYQAAGRKVEKVLRDANLSYTTMIYKEDLLIPDEKSVGSLTMAYDNTCDILIAIGSGTINDIVKFFSFKMNLSYYSIGTAPSMDGFISTAAAMTTNNLKTTYISHVPGVFIGDLDVFSKAPMSMIAAGFGDIMGKYTCLQDWKMSSIVNDEFYCDYIADLVLNAVDTTRESFHGLLQRDKGAIKKLTHGLLLSGIAMSFVGNSRPASGSEHHMSHFFEMLYQYEKKEPILHGTKVGMTTILSLKLYELLKEEEIDFEEVFKSYDHKENEWESEIKSIYKGAWEGIIDLEKKSGKNSYKKWEKRVDSTKNKIDEIKKLCKNLPSSKEIESLIKALEGPTDPSDLGIDKEAVFHAIVHAKEIRDRYTILQLLWDLGLLEKYANKLVYNKD